MLRWGILGTAKINSEVISALRISTYAELLAVASRSAARAEQYALTWGIPRSYGSYSALLDDPDIDIVYNSLPNSLHAQWAVEAASNGKHVLCEKPLATSLREVDEIIAAANRFGVIITEAFMYLHHPLATQLRGLVRHGDLGELRMIRSAFSFQIGSEHDIRLDSELGGGSLLDSGCYPVSLARFLVGAEPAEVFGWYNLDDSGVDRAFAGQLRFPDRHGSIIAQFDCGFQGPYRREVEIVGSEGYARIANPYKSKVGSFVLFDSLGHARRTISVDIPHQLYLPEIDDLNNAIRTGQPQLVSLAYSRGNISTMAALLESARTGRSAAPTAS